MSFLLSFNPVFIKSDEQFVCFRTCIGIFFVKTAKFCINSPILWCFCQNRGLFSHYHAFWGTVSRKMASKAPVKLAIWSSKYSKDSPCSVEHDDGARFAKQQK